MVRNYVKEFDIDISNCNVSVEVFNEEVDYQIQHVCDLVPYFDDDYDNKVAKLAIQCALFQFDQSLYDIPESQKQL
jgi:hypothetical protein